MRVRGLVAIALIGATMAACTDSPAEFVTAATTPTGLPPDVVTGYGLHWWIDDDGAGQRSFTAVGYGGQYVAVVPDRDLVVVVTNNPEGPPDPGSLLTGTILPGVT